VKLDLAELLKPLIEEIVRTTLEQVDADRGRIGFPEAEAAMLLGLQKHVLADCRRRGEISARKIGKQCVYSAATLRRFVSQSER
jgi:hypothetical protein